MVEPLFRFDSQAKVGQTVLLDGAEGHHAAAVRRIRAGEAVQLTNGETTHWRGVVSSVTNKYVEILISEENTIESPKQEFVLVQSLAKGDRDELAVQAATEIGVSRVVPWQADRSVSKWDQAKAAKGQARWQTICDEASKQSLRARFVRVAERQTSNQICDLIAANDGLWLILDPTADMPITRADLSNAQSVYLVVGPEGGITDQELKDFANAGAKRVHLGSGIMRTSTAGVAALSYLSGATGLWG